MQEEFFTTCTRDCPDSCSVLVTVKDGRVVGHRGNPAHPITRGFLCSKGHRYLERFASQQRLLYPERRSANGSFERVSWDEALTLLAQKLAVARDTHGPCSVLALSYSGMRGWVARVLWRLFFAHFGGATFTHGGLSLEPADAAQQLDFGGPGAHAPQDMVNARGFVAWGRNLVVTRQHWMPFIKEAQRQGAPLFVVDPLRTATAKLADRHLQLRPGSDAALALGVGRLLLERGAFDQDFASFHTNGFDAYVALLRSRSLAEVAHETGLRTTDIEALAALYAQTHPVATFVGLGPSNHEDGGRSTRLIDALAALSGHVGVSGGGVNTDFDSSVGLNLEVLASAPQCESRSLCLARLGAELSAATQPPISVGIIAGSNPVASAPDSHLVRESLRNLDFLCVIDQFRTATAQIADLVLPCTTYLEADDLVTAYGHAYLGLTRQVVKPLGQAKPDPEIFQLLAERLGFGSALAGEPNLWIRRLLTHLNTDGVTLERLQAGPCRNPKVPTVAFAGRTFATLSGKLELLTEHTTIPWPKGALRLVATKTRELHNLQVTSPSDLPEQPVVRVHPNVLSKLGIVDGDPAVVESRVGRVAVKAVADAELLEDVLLFNPALWQGDALGVNQLREARTTDIGQAAAMHATAVTLRRP